MVSIKLTNEQFQELCKVVREPQYCCDVWLTAGVKRVEGSAPIDEVFLNIKTRE